MDGRTNGWANGRADGQILEMESKLIGLEFDMVSRWNQNTFCMASTQTRHGLWDSTWVVEFLTRTTAHEKTPNMYLAAHLVEIVYHICFLHSL